MMSLQERERVLSAYRFRAEEFKVIAAKRARRSSVSASSDATDRAVTQTTSTGLSAREVDVLTLIASGWSNGEVAARLCISEETVKAHVSHVLAKLHARNRAHAVAFAIRRGLITDAASVDPRNRLAAVKRETPQDAGAAQEALTLISN